ncbi:MAG: 5-formyltetrahydrofolate cyclo-ligase [Rhodospirillales bacterium]|nr:5-formyltetrahydrofolate cyclo-ligase [Rhodospirillales bacterium]
MNEAARPELDAEKAGFRAEMQLKRERARAAGGPAAALALRDRFFEGPGRLVRELPGAVVSGFWPFGPEIDVRPILYHLHAAGHPIALPVVVRRGLPLLFRAWRPGLAMVSGSFGVSRPDKDQPELTPRVLIVPLLAFDRRGYRLGYGGGFYDRTLALLRTKGPTLAIGVGFAVQEVPATPRDHSDERLDWMVTEREAFPISLEGMTAGDAAP